MENSRRRIETVKKRLKEIETETDALMNRIKADAKESSISSKKKQLTTVKDWCSDIKIKSELQKALEVQWMVVPRWRGCRGGKQGVEMMSGKLKADTTNNYAYNKILQPFANKLRKEMTKAEACLWKYALRASQDEGVSIQKTKAGAAIYS